VPAASYHIQDHERQQIQVCFHCRDLPDAFPKEIALCLYRVAQEGLRNVARHAEADRIEIVLNTDDEFVHLEVRDSGRGFDPGAVRGNAGLGLASMVERAHLVGSRLTVSSQPGQGTSVAARIPIPEDLA
jgi:signal transduction histidine kinase